MTTNTAPQISAEDRAAEEALATRYVLGELSEEEFAEFEARYATDAAFRARYTAWSEGLNALDAKTAEDAPLATGIVGLIGRLGVVPAVIGALAAALLVVFVTNMGVLTTDQLATSTSTVLGTEDGEIIAEAQIEDSPAAVTIRLLGTAPEADRVFELWLVQGAGTPASLGVLSAAQSTTLPLSPQQAAELGGGVLVLTQEPVGGAGAAGPTGDVIAAGAFVAPE